MNKVAWRTTLAALALACSESAPLPSPDAGTHASGDGGSPGVKLVFLSASSDLGNVALGRDAPPVILTLQNMGTETSLPVVVTASPTVFRVVKDECARSLTPGLACFVTVVFTPAGLGPATGSLQAVAGGASASAELKGTGVRPPLLVVSPADADFGDVPVGFEGTPMAFTIGNQGDLPAAAPMSAVTGDFAIQTTTCPAMGELPAGGACGVTVVFGPGSIGVKRGTLTISATDVAPAVSMLHGRGADDPGLLFTPGTLDFGRVSVGTRSAAQVVRFTNTGASPVTGLQIAVSGSLDFKATQDCGDTVKPGASCDISVIFAPTAPGPRTAILVGSWPDGNAMAGLSGAGVRPDAGLVVSPSSVDFALATIGASSLPVTLTVTNEGDAPLDGLTFELSGTEKDEFRVESGDCGVLLAGGASCHPRVTFVPFRLGQATATLTARTKIGAASVALSGWGVDGGSINISPQEKDFGSIVMGSESDAFTFMITSPGAGDLQDAVGTIAGPNAGDFLTNHLCVPVAVTGYAACTIQVRFSPLATGARTGALSISAGGRVSSVPLKGNGLPQPELPIEPRQVDFGGVTVGQVSSIQTFAVINASGTAGPALQVKVDAPFELASDTCTAKPVPAGQSCSVGVRFRPTAVGSFSGTLAFGDSQGHALGLASLRGAGLAGLDGAGAAR